jgi:molybdate transport system substrate-binding protein
VFAAASLTEAFTELGALMEKRHPGLSLRFNFAGSQQLATQIEHGAEADIFASADDRWMSYAGDHGLLGATPRPFVRNRLVVIVPASNPAGIHRLENLARPGTKLVLAAEAVPVGRYSRQALQKLSTAPGFDSGYAGQVLKNVVSEEENVKSVAAKVTLGEADAGVVYRSDVTPAVARSVRMLEIPDAFNVSASYPIAPLKASRDRELADAFIDLVLSEEGQAVLARHGFVPVNAAAAATPAPTR